MRTTGAVALLALGAVGLAACSHGSSSPTAPKVAAPAVARAASFRVVYKVTDTAGPQTQISTDVLQVDEPWNARLEHRDGPPPGGAISSSTVQNERFTFSTAETAQGFATRRVPGPLTQAPSPEALQAAAAAGLVDRPGDDTVAGEPCTRWIYKASNEVLARGTPDEHTESCVTGDGVPLRESITLQGRLVRVSEAVQVDRHPPVTADTFDSNQDPGTGNGQNLLESEQLVTEGPRSGKGVVAVTPPVGFRNIRQVTVNRQAGENSAPVSLYVQAFGSGSDLVTTEQVMTPGRPPWSVDEGGAVNLGASTRTGRIAYRTGWAEVRVTLGSRNVLVSAPRPEVALAVARTLRV